jgi:hypothetical protein
MLWAQKRYVYYTVEAKFVSLGSICRFFRLIKYVVCGERSKTVAAEWASGVRCRVVHLLCALSPACFAAFDRRVFA